MDVKSCQDCYKTGDKGNKRVKVNNLRYKNSLQDLKGIL